jgi:putative oxidoreductase
MVPKFSYGLAILRVVVGLIYVMHGYPKLFGGLDATTEMLSSLGFPVAEAFAIFLVLLETVGGALLIAGLFATPIAILFIIEMTIGIVLVHAANGFYVIGPGQGGIELNLLLIASLLALVLAGPGAWTLDARRRLR